MKWLIVFAYLVYNPVTEDYKVFSETMDVTDSRHGGRNTCLAYETDRALQLEFLRTLNKDGVFKSPWIAVDLRAECIHGIDV